MAGGAVAQLPGGRQPRDTTSLLFSIQVCHCAVIDLYSDPMVCSDVWSCRRQCGFRSVHCDHGSAAGPPGGILVHAPSQSHPSNIGYVSVSGLLTGSSRLQSLSGMSRTFFVFLFCS